MQFNVPSHAPWRGRLVVLAGIVLVGLNLRLAVAALSPIIEVVRQDFALSATQVGLLGTVPVASFAVFGSLATPLARRLGLEPTLILALLLSMSGELLRALAGGAPALIGWSVLALAGMGMGNVLLPPLVKRYFPDRIGAVTAAYSVAMSFSTAVPPLVALPVAVAAGWRVSLGMWAVLGFAAVVPWVVVIVQSVQARSHLRGLLRRAPRSDRPAVLVRPGAQENRLVWRSSLAWALVLTFFANTTCVYVLFAWLPQILDDAGLGADVGGWWLAVFAIVGLPASLLAPVLTARMRNPYLLVAGFAACWAAGLVGLMLWPAHGTAVWMVLLGIGPGSFPVLLTLIGLRSRTPSTAVALSGMVQGLGYGLAIAGPVGIGVLHGATGSWHGPILVLLGLVALLLVAGWFACRPTMLGAEAPA
ncbi:MFS transporter [Cellulomonas fengjieae]|uniref:MFS transporter n=1 Tax=Cellulomonas fengjieae TaxID=2819978 RepID=A0ABS3SKV1_9CELL|nr:MFS transporter [Cellulomonas fengjieae]MBO3086379.1 MFS transporter [Cellulomonas fengjieae]QVI66749.1 MFS transporter [Cellulomonas fengjieae]